MATPRIDWTYRSENVNRETGRLRLVKTQSEAIEAEASMYPLGENHPLASTFGAFRDEPLWDDFMRAVDEYRQEVESQEEEE